MLHKLPKLFYEYDAFEPYVDKETVRIHHTKHHQGYVNKLNESIKGISNLINMSVEEILIQHENIDNNIRQNVVNYAGGHANHNLYWKSLQPKNINSKPRGKLKDAIKSTFGNIKNFQDQFKRKAMGVFGSGWVFLVVNEKGKLELTRQSFQNSPLMYGQQPILTIDVWEHAYYLKYQNNRAEYVDAFTKIINWKEVGSMFLEVVKK